MAYEKTDWKNREVERPRTYNMQHNDDGTVTLIPAEGEIIEAGTPIIASLMNKIEQGIADAHDGIIVESGSNSNGNYVMFADGTLICYLHRAIKQMDVALSLETYPFPASIRNPVVTMGIADYNNVTNRNIANEVIVAQRGGIYSGYWEVINLVSGSGTMAINLFAIGRWK